MRLFGKKRTNKKETLCRCSVFQKRSCTRHPWRSEPPVLRLVAAFVSPTQSRRRGGEDLVFAVAVQRTKIKPTSRQSQCAGNKQKRLKQRRRLASSVFPPTAAAAPSLNVSHLYQTLSSPDRRQAGGQFGQPSICSWHRRRR